jgi:hypothetical protein
MLTRLIDVLHIGLIFLPLWMLFLSKRYFSRKQLMILLAIYVTIPIHWYYFNNKCIVTFITGKLGGHENATSDKSPFSEIYLRWYYEPFLNLFGFKWNDEMISKCALITATINIIIIWYILWQRI